MGRRPGDSIYHVPITLRFSEAEQLLIDRVCIRYHFHVPASELIRDAMELTLKYIDQHEHELIYGNDYGAARSRRVCLRLSDSIDLLLREACDRTGIKRVSLARQATVIGLRGYDKGL